MEKSGKCPSIVRVKFWTRVTRNGREQWQLIEGRGDGGVPEICWRKYNAAFWRRLREGSLKPADPLACYQAGCEAMMAAAGRPVKLLHASPTTYIIAAGLMRMRQFVREEVAPRRDEQRQMFDRCRVNGVLDVQAFVENLPALAACDAAQARALARVCVAETLARCAPRTRTGLRAYLAADLYAAAAARALGASPQSFAYQRDHHWFPEFRANCGWRW